MNAEKQTVSDIGVSKVGVKNMDYKTAGYLSKAGKPGTYKHTASAESGGGSFTYRDAKEHGGEWSEDYCGC